MWVEGQQGQAEYLKGPVMELDLRPVVLLPAERAEPTSKEILLFTYHFLPEKLLTSLSICSLCINEVVIRIKGAKCVAHRKSSINVSSLPALLIPWGWEALGRLRGNGSWILELVEPCPLWAQCGPQVVEGVLCTGMDNTQATPLQNATLTGPQLQSD